MDENQNMPQDESPPEDLEEELPEEEQDEEPEEVKEGGSKAVPIILGLILVVLIALGLYWIYTNNQEQKDKEAEEQKSAIEGIVDDIKDIINAEPENCIASDYDGKTYKDGESYTTDDGCQTCTCKDGSFNCKTDSDCLNRPAAGCTYNGTDYNSGETFSAGDNCNTCTCQDGSVNCTSDPCETEESVDDTSAPDGTAEQ